MASREEGQGDSARRHAYASLLNTQSAGPTSAPQQYPIRPSPAQPQNPAAESARTSPQALPAAASQSPAGHEGAAAGQARQGRQSGGGGGGGEGERRKRQPCSFFLKTGNCAFGSECKFEHPQDQPATQYNSLGLPLRPGEPDCAYYVKNLHCGYGGSCKFHHAEPVYTWAVPMPGGSPGAMMGGYSSVAPQAAGVSGRSYPASPLPHMHPHHQQMQMHHHHMQQLHMAAQAGVPVSPHPYPSVGPGGHMPMGHPPYIHPHPHQQQQQSPQRPMTTPVHMQMQSPPRVLPGGQLMSPPRPMVDPRVWGGGYGSPAQAPYAHLGIAPSPLDMAMGFGGGRMVGPRPESAFSDVPATPTTESSGSSRPREGRSRRRGRGKLNDAPIAVDALLNPERSSASSTLAGRPDQATATPAAPPPSQPEPEDPAEKLFGLSLEGEPERR